MTTTPQPESPDDTTSSEQILLEQLHQVQRALEREYAERRRQETVAAACAEKIATLEENLAETQAHLSAVLSSRSWRITAPIRRLLRRGG